MDQTEPSVADVLEFESWPEEQRKLAERVLGKKYKALFFNQTFDERRPLGGGWPP